MDIRISLPRTTNTRISWPEAVVTRRFRPDVAKIENFGGAGMGGTGRRDFMPDRPVVGAGHLRFLPQDNIHQTFLVGRRRHLTFPIRRLQYRTLLAGRTASLPLDTSGWTSPKSWILEGLGRGNGAPGLHTRRSSLGRLVVGAGHSHFLLRNRRLHDLLVGRRRSHQTFPIAIFQYRTLLTGR